jgi:hypothetical protein
LRRIGVTWNKWQHLRGSQFNNEKLEMAVSEWLQMDKANFYCDRIFKCTPRWGKCINVLGDYVEK